MTISSSKICSCLDPGVESAAAEVKAESDNEDSEERRGPGGQETGDQETGDQEKMSYGDPGSGVPGVMDTEDTMGVYRTQSVNQAFSHHRSVSQKNKKHVHTFYLTTVYYLSNQPTRVSLYRAGIVTIHGIPGIVYFSY